MGEKASPRPSPHHYRGSLMRTLKAKEDWFKLSAMTPDRVFDYGVAIALVAAATLVNLLAWPTGSDQDGHYFALVAAVLLSSLYGGLGPGLFATAIGGLSSAYFSLVPQFSVDVID